MDKLMRALILMTVALMSGASSAQAQTAAPAGGNPASTQKSDGGITANGVIGDVAVIDASGKQMFVKTAAGSVVIVSLDDATTYMRVAPGEKDLKNATKTTLAEIGIGDRVFARGKVADDQKSVPARMVIVMSKADISKKNEGDRAKWRERGVVGVVSALNPDTKEITLQMRGRGGAQQLTVVANADTVKFRRYAPDSVKFDDAKPSSFAELKVGDQLRALGEKSADGARFTPEEVVSGSFRTMFGTVTAVNPQANEIKIKDTQTQQELTVMVSKDSMTRRFPADIAQMMAMRAESGGPGRIGGGPQRQGGAPGEGNNARPAGSGGAPDGAGQSASGGGGQRRRMGGGIGSDGGGGMDFTEMLDRMPEATIAELKPGDTLIVSSTAGTEPSRVTAIHLIAGADALVNMMTQRRARTGPGVDGVGAGMSGLGIDFGIGLP